MTAIHFRPLLAVSAVALIAAACSDRGADVAEGKPAAQTASAPAPAVAADPIAPQFVQTAVTTDIVAIDASRVALERSQNYDVKQYAQKVIDARSKAGGELQVALSATGLPVRPSTNLPQDKAAAVAELRTAEPAQVDRLYLDTTVKAHEEALKVLEQYAEEGATPQLRAFAEKEAEEVREQRQQARTLLDRVS